MIIDDSSPKDHPDKTLVVIVGPTAIGKTGLAIKIANFFNTSVISADSRQFFRELKIGTAAPTAEEKQLAVHHFAGHLSIHDPYNVSMFEGDVLHLLEVLFRERDFAVMTGGSGLYIDAVCKGIDNMPGADPGIRMKVEELYQKYGIEYLQNELRRLDPEYFAVVDKANPNRLKRALEVCLATGRTFTSFRKDEPALRPFNILKVGVNRPRHELFDRIARRTGQMIDQGLVEEVRGLLPFRHLNALNTVGYKEIFDYLDEKVTLEQAIENMKTNTRRYAKRQLTWFKRDKEIRWFLPEHVEEILEYIKNQID